MGCPWDMFKTSCLFPPLLLRAEQKGDGLGHLGPYTSCELTIEFLLQMREMISLISWEELQLPSFEKPGEHATGGCFSSGTGRDSHEG